MSLSIETLVLARKYTKETVNGLGALKGAPCTISNIEEVDNGNIVTFQWTGADGSIQTTSMVVQNGSGGGVENISIDENGHLICYLTNGTIIDAGQLPTGGTTAGNIWVGTTEEYAALTEPLPEDTVVIFTDDENGSGGGYEEDLTEIKEQLSNIETEMYVDKISTNLVNSSNIIEGMVVKTDGSLSANSTYNTGVDYIPIKPGQTYIHKGCLYFATYDENKNFIARPYWPKETPFTFNDNVAYVRVSSNSVPAVWQFNEGSVLLPYEPYYNYKESKIQINSNAIEDINNRTGAPNSRFYHGELKTFKSDFSEWYGGMHANYSDENFNDKTLYTSIIQKFDQFIEDAPSYVSKIERGAASDGQMLYEYIFKPNIQVSNGIKRITPKVLVDCGIHGFEKSSTYGMYYFLYDLVYNWTKNKSLESVRNGVEIHIIPVVNPSGFDANTYVNSNGVNINRNFDTSNWTYVSPEENANNASGDAPFSEGESRAVKAMHDDNPDAFLYINGHTNGKWYATGYTEANACMTEFLDGDSYQNRMAYAFNRHIEMQTARFNTYDGINTGKTNFGRYQISGSHPGTASAWGLEKTNTLTMNCEGFNGVNAGTTGVADYVVPVFTSLGYKMNSEIFGNMIIQMIFEYSS